MVYKIYQYLKSSSDIPVDNNYYLSRQTCKCTDTCAIHIKTMKSIKQILNENFSLVHKKRCLKWQYDKKGDYL